MKNINSLTATQEIALLNLLAQRYDVADHGAARLVYTVENEDLTECGIAVERDCRYVVKVAIGLAGLNQNEIEANTYCEQGDGAPLARIIYVGRYLEVMERVYHIEGCNSFNDLREYAGYVDHSEDKFIAMVQDYHDISTSDTKEIYAVIRTLTTLFGQTNDNGQLGVTLDGRIVAFDYGYIVDSDMRLCSELAEMAEIDESNFVADYLKRLVDAVRGGETLVVEDIEEKLLREIGW